MSKFISAAAALMLLTSAGVALAQNNNAGTNPNNETGTKDCENMDASTMTEEMKVQCSAAAQQGAGADATNVDATGSTLPVEDENTDKKTDDRPAN
jgi:hypothetical protein